MPAPAAAQMKTQAVALYGQQLGPQAIEYLDKLFAKVVSAWDVWQKGITFGALTVSGGGIGAWSGAGIGGVMAGSPFTMQPFSFYSNSPQQLKFTQALATALQQKFTPYPATFKFKNVQYTGSCGATPINPGPVSAACVPAPMAATGEGTNPSGIADVWKKLLLPPEFQLTSPQAKSGELIDAISGSIEQSFQTFWLATTMITGNSLSTGAPPGGVVAGAPSGNDGKLL